MTLRHREARCFVAEAIGTFAIVLFGCGTIAVVPTDPTKHLIVNLVFGSVVAVMIAAFGHISRAHFNPAVTLGFAVTKRISWRCALGYWASQFCGASIAALLLKTLIVGPSGATIPSTAPFVAVALEAIMTFFLMLVIVSVATDQRAPKSLAAIAIGGTVAMCGLFCGPLTGNSLNPARSMGPAIFDPHAVGPLWIYFMGPAIGAVLAASLYGWLGYGSQVPACAESCC